MKERLDKIETQLAAMQATLDKLLKGQSKKQANPETIINYIKNAHLYKDEPFAYFLNKGIMPRRKLLKLSRLSAAEIDPIITAMIATKRIHAAPCVDEKGRKSEIGYSIL